MERRKNKKKLCRRIAAMLLIAGLMIVLLCGCSHGPNDRMQTEPKEPSAPPESELLDTMAKAVAYVEEMVQAGATEFSLVCSADVYEALIKTTYMADGAERKAFHSLPRLNIHNLFLFYRSPPGILQKPPFFHLLLLPRP